MNKPKQKPAGDAPEPTEAELRLAEFKKDPEVRLVDSTQSDNCVMLSYKTRVLKDVAHFKVGDYVQLRKVVWKKDGRRVPSSFLNTWLMTDVGYTYHPTEGFKMAFGEERILLENVFVKKDWL